MHVSFKNDTSGRLLGQYLNRFLGQNNPIELPPKGLDMTAAFRDTMNKMLEDPMKWMAGLSESCSAAGQKLMNVYLGTDEKDEL